MTHNHFTMKEGFLIGGGIIFAGLILQLCIGPVIWEAFAWPVNGIVLTGFLFVIAIIFLLRKRIYIFRFIGTYQAAIPTLVYAAILTIIMGLIKQDANGSWLGNMLTFWPFVLTYAFVAVILGVITLKRLCHFSSNGYVRNMAFLLNHLGLFLALITATLGNADLQRVKMVVSIDEPEQRAITADGAIKEMPFTIILKRFIMETYDNGAPKRFASEIRIDAKAGKSIEATVDVNKPYEVNGWKIYQYSYDTQMGPNSRISILELVSDPWLPFVYTGIYMMLAGAVCMFVLDGRRKEK